jgi:hypothetical protein
MYTKTDFLQSVDKEIDIIKHLFTKVTLEQMDFKPTEGQRTKLELVQYLSHIGAAGTEMVLTGETGGFAKFVEQGKKVSFENFAEAMDAQKATIHSMVEPLTDEQLSEKVNIFMMGENTKGVYLVNTVLKWLVAYKMQLFLYMKQSGTTAIGTSNLWGGFDMPQK